MDALGVVAIASIIYEGWKQQRLMPHFDYFWFLVSTEP